MIRFRSVLATAPSTALAFGLSAGIAACGSGAPSAPSTSTSSPLGASSAGGGQACSIATLASQNLRVGACQKNSLGGYAFGSSCTGNGGQPEYWCADFARWVWAESGADVSGLTPAAGSFYTYGQAHGTLSDTPAVGDAVVFDYAGGGYADHVAIVSQVNSDGSIETISGDWGGEDGTEAQFSSTSYVALNAPAYPGVVGTWPTVMGMKISGFVAPYGIMACGGSGGGGYAFVEVRGGDRRYPLDPTSGTSDFPFVWHDATGLAPASDLSVEVGGRSVLQVSSIGAHPFVRAGLDVAPIAADADYRVVLARQDDDELAVTVEDASGKELVRTLVAGRARAAGVVLPARSWRTSVTSARLER